MLTADPGLFSSVSADLTDSREVGGGGGTDGTEEKKMARPGSGLLVPVNGLGYPPQSMARVVVWEWLNEHGRWRPYSAAVCHHIENVQKGDARGSVVLGQVDGQLSPYVIDLQSMHQFRQDTGEELNEHQPGVSQTLSFEMTRRTGLSLALGCFFALEVQPQIQS